MRLAVLNLKHNLNVKSQENTIISSSKVLTHLSERIKSLGVFFFEVLPRGKMHLVSSRLEIFPAEEVGSSSIVIGYSDNKNVHF